MKNSLYLNNKFFRLMQPLVDCLYKIIFCKVFGHEYQCIGESVYFCPNCVTYNTTGVQQ